MNRLTVTTLFLVFISCQCFAGGFTVSFDDFSPGKELYYYDQGINSVCFNSYEVIDHSESTWGQPHSGKNVLGWSGNGSPLVAFGNADYNGRPLVNMQHFGVYFSTTLGTVLNLKIYKYHPPHGVLIQNIRIGSTTEAWDNKYIEMYSPTGDINGFMLEAVSQGALSGFCLDDLTVTPVPEPSSILALLGGLAGIGGIAWRRR